MPILLSYISYTLYQSDFIFFSLPVYIYSYLLNCRGLGGQHPPVNILSVWANSLTLMFPLFFSYHFKSWTLRCSPENLSEIAPDLEPTSSLLLHPS